MIFDIFSERKRTRQEPSPYQYDEIPEDLRYQIFYVLRDTVGAFFQFEDDAHQLWWCVWDFYCKEKGLPPNATRARDAGKNCIELIMEGDIEGTFDIIEILFGLMSSRGVPQDELEKHASELNRFFQKSSFGWKLKNNQIMKIDSAHIVEEIIEPVLDFLRNREFKSANEQFLSAHEHYRNGRYGDCITNASSAFETVIKIICDGKKWNYGSRSGSRLVTFLLDKDEFIPKYLRSHFEQLIPTLWSGLFPTRNNHPPGHGQKTAEVYAYIAGYALHLAATNTLLLVQIYESKKQNNA